MAMASRTARAPFAFWMAICCDLAGIATAIPAVAFPFNSQVPTVARVDAPYSFEISDSTFWHGPTDLTYSLSDHPAWLAINSATRTLTGTPGAGDVGSTSFTLTAIDNTGSVTMPCTLVVSRDAPPRLSGDIGRQLAATANLSSINPPVVTLLPSTVFNFEFQQESFIDIVQRKLYYYATLSDHTPLPSWLHFDSERLTFSGTAPSLSAFPQSWSIQLIASDVPGFSATSTSFTISIGTEQLAFVPEEQDWNIATGKRVKLETLGDQLFRNNEKLPSQEWESAAVSSLPSWLNFDPATLVIEGDVPGQATQQNFSITVKDRLGNSATAVVNVVPGNVSLFERQVGTITAEAGKMLRYHLEDSLFSESNLDLSIALPPPEAQWLEFDAASRELTGTPPTRTEATTVKAMLTANPKDGGEGQSQVFTIEIRSARTKTPTSTLETRTSPSSSATSTSTPATGLAIERPRENLGGGVIATIVILSLIGTGLLIACLLWCCKRRRQRGYGRHSPPLSKQQISRPTPPPEGEDTITVTTELQTDVEKTAGIEDTSQPMPASRAEPPPQITLNSLNLPSQRESRKARWSKRFSRMSYASSLGQGDAAIRADKNIPEWGQDLPELHTPHDSFSVPAEMARSSRHPSQMSPGKRARHQKHRSSDTIGLGITTKAIGGLARHSSKRVTKHRRSRSSFAGLSTTREASSMVSLNTTGTSVLSTRPSEFPLPPQSETSRPALSVTTTDTLADPKRRSIRLVQRSDSIADNRPAAEKRESFIRNRAIALRSRTSVQSPLFAHGSRTSSLHAKQNSRSANNSLAGSVRHTRRSKHGKSMLTTYSESSSLEPQPNDPRRSHTTRESKRLSQRVKSTFAPNFPRVMSRHSTLYSAQDEDKDFYTTSSSMNSSDWIEEAASEAWMKDMHKPRQERSWVYPEEASPTPEPAQRRPPSSPRASLKVPGGVGKDRSSSPLASNVQVIEPTSVSTFVRRHRNRLSEPIDLVSADSVNKSWSRQRLRESEQQAGAGGEEWEEFAPRPSSGKAGTQRSDLSGPAFL